MQMGINLCLSRTGTVTRISLYVVRQVHHTFTLIYSWLQIASLLEETLDLEAQLVEFVRLYSATSNLEEGFRSEKTAVAHKESI